MPLRYERRMSDADAAYLKMDADPRLRPSALGVLVYDSPISRSRLWTKMDQTIAVIPRLRQRVVDSPLSTAPPAWVDDPEFDIDYHVQVAKAPGDGSMRALLNWVRPFAMHPLDPARPLWEWIVVEGFEGHKTVTVIKQHHAITDGVGGIELAKALFDLEPDPVLEAPPAREPDVPTAATLFAESWAGEAHRLAAFSLRTARRARDAAADPGWAAGRARSYVRAARRLARVTRQRPLSPLLQTRSAGVHFDRIVLPLAALKAAGRAVGGTVNDIYLAGFAAGMRRYHQHHGAPTAAIRVMMPMNVRAPGAEQLAGNEVSGAFLELPLDIEEPAVLVMTIGEQVADWRADRDAVRVANVGSGLINRLPGPICRRLMLSSLTACDATCTNVPGIPIPIWFAGAKNELVLGLGPRTGVAVHLTMTTFLEKASIGINTDPAAVRDPDLLTSFLEESYAELIGLG
jgi:WS/DGAT/MGAT family acyltransferase